MHGKFEITIAEFEPIWEIYRSHAKLTAQNTETGTRSLHE